MATTCDGCGTRANVRKDYVTFWNGNGLDLCVPCSGPVGKVLDELWDRGNGGGENPAPLPAPRPAGGS